METLRLLHAILFDGFYLRLIEESVDTLVTAPNTRAFLARKVWRWWEFFDGFLEDVISDLHVRFGLW
jgi:hypothetical protein